MTRALVHIGLALALVVAPALCCCKARGLVPVANAGQATPTHPQPAQTHQPTHSCCEKVVRSCCHEESDAPPATRDQKSAPAPQHAPCACCVERPTAAQTESKPTVAAAEPTGELLPQPHLLAAATEHRGLVRGAHPPNAGADAKSAALFDRHVMRC